MPNEFDNVIMVSIVITCRANEKEGKIVFSAPLSVGMNALLEL